MGRFTLYLLESVGLDASTRYMFIFLDGTGVYATPVEFDGYATRRFAAFPDDSYEIMPDSYSSESRRQYYELPLPDEAWADETVFSPELKKEDRF